MPFVRSFPSLPEHLAEPGSFGVAGPGCERAGTAIINHCDFGNTEPVRLADRLDAQHLIRVQRMPYGSVSAGWHCGEGCLR